MQAIDEGMGGQRGKGAQPEKEKKVPGAGKAVIGEQGKFWVIADPRPQAHSHGGRCGADNYQPEIMGRKTAHNDLQGEHDPRHGSIKGGGNTTGRAAGHGKNNHAVRKAQPLGDRRAQRGTYVDNGPFPAGRTAGTNGNGGSDHLNQGDPRTDTATQARHGEHHLRHPVALRLRGQIFGNQADDEPSQGDNRNRPGNARPGLKGAAETFLKQILHEVDGVAQSQRRKSGPHTNDNRE